MRATLAVATVVAALLAPAGATAGGFATVGVDPLPDGIGPGEHLAGPADDPPARPYPARRPKAASRRLARIGAALFAARPAGPSGVYSARVVFPSLGHLALRGG